MVEILGMGRWFGSKPAAEPIEGKIHGAGCGPEEECVPKTASADRKPALDL